MAGSNQGPGEEGAAAASYDEELAKCMEFELGEARQLLAELEVLTEEEGILNPVRSRIAKLEERVPKAKYSKAPWNEGTGEPKAPKQLQASIKAMEEEGGDATLTEQSRELLAGIEDKLRKQAEQAKLAEEERNKHKPIWQVLQKKEAHLAKIEKHLQGMRQLDCCQ